MANLSGDTVLSAEYMNGMTINEWLGPDPIRRKKTKSLRPLTTFSFWDIPVELHSCRP